MTPTSPDSRAPDTAGVDPGAYESRLLFQNRDMPFEAISPDGRWVANPVRLTATSISPT